MKQNSALYAQVIAVTEDYLGPSAKRFIDRQIENHLQKKPENLTKKDLSTLNDWIIAVVALLTEDEELLAEYSNRLESLFNNRSSKE